MEFNVGQIFGEYSIAGVISTGSAGTVYKVEHRLTKRAEAMKVLSTEHAGELEIKRFEREIRALARLNHPNIAALHNAIRHENHVIVFMELVDGRTLESLLSAGRLPMETGLGYVRQILLALEYAHQQGVVHRDVTPAHVVITAAGEVKLTDFGLAKSVGDPLLTTCGEIQGSLAYLAPERVKGKTHPDFRSDLYSTGAILYEHLTGKKPFGAERKLAPILTDSEAPPQPPSALAPDLSPAWDQVIARTLHRDPMHRYQSAAEFLGALSRLDSPSQPQFQMRYLGALGLGAATAGLVLAVIAWPAIRNLGAAEPALAGFEPRSIAPPAFALAIEKPVAQTAEPAALKHPQHRRRLASAAERNETAPLNLARPQPLRSEIDPTTILIATPASSVMQPSMSHAGSNQAMLAPPAPKPAAAAPPAAAAAPTLDPEIADPGPALPPPAKKSFWKRLDVFHRRHRSDAADPQ